MVISVTEHLPGLSPPTPPGSLTVETPRVFHAFLPGGEDGKGAGAAGVRTPYILAWQSLGVGERNGQGVRMGYTDFWSAPELGVKGGANVHAPQLPLTQDTYTYLYLPLVPQSSEHLVFACPGSQTNPHTHPHLEINTHFSSVNCRAVTQLPNPPKYTLTNRDTRVPTALQCSLARGHFMSAYKASTACGVTF